jgi:iron complex transport system permease protein
VGIFLLLILNLSFGDGGVPVSETFSILSGGAAENDTWSFIVEHRLNRSVVAIMAGGALAVSGLILQVFFRNPLAGPGVLGVTSGASLGVALIVMGGVTLSSVLQSSAIVIAGIIGAFSVLLLLLFLSKYIRNQITLLVVGLMIGYFVSALVNILFLAASETETRAYVIWGLGSFEKLSSLEVLIFGLVISLFVLFSLMLSKSLNALVLGEDYAKSLGVNMKLLRLSIVLVTSVLAAVVTVYCGPISFIGIAVPQLIVLVLKSRNYSWFIPICFLGGAFLGLASDLIVRWSDNSLPLNTVTAIIGAPIIIWTIVKLNHQFAKS